MKSGLTHNGGVSANAYARARAVSHGPLAVLVEPVGDITELRARADGGLPGVGVHGELLHVLQVDDERAVLASDAEVAVRFVLAKAADTKLE